MYLSEKARSSNVRIQMMNLLRWLGNFLLAQVLSNVPPATPLSYEHRIKTGNGSGMRSLGIHYGHESLSMRNDGYGTFSSYSSKLYGRLPPPSALEMVILGYVVGKVMSKGKGGSNT
ncbi:hypothetical protein HAX54_030664 [Datura stramonium]|uniref:Uncharacterized protein n=1 Tax=Datura stramonium TaxID=4076 RepID=A0ABS8VA40_DATST|nr:hypothetical protein [Datura stramonium]